MRPEAVRQQGVAKLNAMNEGRGGPGSAQTNVTVNMNIRAWDGRSVRHWLLNGGSDLIASTIKTRRAEGQWFW